MCRYGAVQTPAENQAENFEDERRRYGRFRCRGEVVIFCPGSGAQASGKIADLSFSGCLVSVGQPALFGELDTVEVTLSVYHHTQRLRGRIRAVRPDHSLGIEFTDVTTRGARLLRELIQELAARWKRGLRR
jgi:PilZ domain